MTSGLDAEALAWKLSGCLVRGLEPRGAVAVDGRIKPGEKSSVGGVKAVTS